MIRHLFRQVGTVARSENRATGMLMSSTANERAKQRAAEKQADAAAA